MSLSSAERAAHPLEVFRARRRQMTITLLIIGAVMAISSVVTQFSYRQAAFSVPKAAAWLVTNVIPDGAALQKLIRKEG